MDDRWQIFFDNFKKTVTVEQLPVKLPRFDLELGELAGAAADWCHQYLKDRKCPSDLIVFLTQKVINNLRVQWAAEPKLFGYRVDEEDYQALWFMQRVIKELNEVCLNHDSIIQNHLPILPSVLWSSFVLKNSRRQMEDYIAVIPYLHTMFNIKDHGEASFYAVYDGHNGLDAAFYSSMYLHQFLVQSEHYSTNPEYALYEAFFITDKGFALKNKKYNLVSGTTAVCALLRPQEKKLYVGWVGDSIATLWKNGTPLCLVNKHVPNRQDETQRIEKEGGMISNCQGIWRVDGQLAVSRAIGDVKYKPHISCQPEMRVLVLDGNEEFLVLCSDGVWEFITPEDIAETIYDELLETDGDVTEVCNKLAYKSKAQGSRDNISVITVFLQDPKQLVAKRRAVIMETAMEQRNANATLASYGQDTGDFGPETDVDTPDEPVGLTKPKVEGETNVIDESGEDSEEDGGGWNYYKKSTETTEKKICQEGDNNSGNNSEAEDMDYKLNPDAPEFVPVSSPTMSTVNPVERFLNMDSDEFISSSPQKFKESIDNVDVPDENDFANEIKVHAAEDLSTLNNPHEPIDDSTMLNGIKPLNEEPTSHDETNDNFVLQNEYNITNVGSVEFQNPFTPEEEKDDLNKVQDLSEYLNDNAQTYNSDQCISLIEPSKNNEFNSTSDNNLLDKESDVKLDDESLGKHIKYEQDMNSRNIDDTINTNDVIADSTSEIDESLKQNDGFFKNEFMDSSHIDKFGLFEDRKLNDSVSTTDAVLGSEPHTPMCMDNQSTFESENDDDQFSESFKQPLQFNQYDENNDKENHDPFCFEPTEDPAGIIPNVTHEEVDETHLDDVNTKPFDSSNDHQVPQLGEHEPIEEPLCIKEKAKPIHSVDEQENLPESDFPSNTHEVLPSANENIFENNVNTEHSDHHNIVESDVENEENVIEHHQVDPHLQQDNYTPELNVPSHTDDLEQEDSEVDDVKEHLEGLKEEFYNENTCEFGQDNNSVNYDYIQTENVEPKQNDTNNEQEFLEDFEQKNDAYNYIQNHDDKFEHNGFETTTGIENIKQEISDVAEVNPNDMDNLKQTYYDDVAIQNHAEDIKEEYNDGSEVLPINVEKVENSKEEKLTVQIEEEIVEAVKSHVDFVETVQSHLEDVKKEHFDNVPELEENHIKEFKQDLHNNAEVDHNNFNDISDIIKTHGDNVESENNYYEELKQEHNINEVEQISVENSTPEYDIAGVSHNHIENLKQEHDNVADIIQNHNEDIPQELNGVDSVPNHTTDSDEEMHSSMIIHSDVENNMPQPYCSSHDTLNEPSDMMCTSMTFEENFQNRNMSDSLYVMETSSNYVGEDIEQINKSTEETKNEEPASNIISELVDPVKADNETSSEVKSELVEESKVAEATEQSSQLSSQDPVEKVDKEEESNKVAEIAVAAAVGTAAIAAVAGVGLASHKSAPKKIETTVSKTKTTTTKTTPTKPLASKTSAPIPKKTSSTTSKPLSRPLTAPSTTSKPATNVRPTTVLKTAIKSTTVTKSAPKTTTSVLKSPAPRPTSAKTTPTTPRTNMTKTTLTSSPKTSTTPKTLATKSPTTPKLSTTPRTSTLLTKQSLTNGSPKPLSRPLSAPAKKPLHSATTNGTTKLTNGTTKLTNGTTKLTNGTSKLTNGDVSKTSTTTKPPVSLSTRMSLAPPKLPPKVKAAPKSVVPPAMPGPIRRPKAPITKKTEATS